MPNAEHHRQTTNLNVDYFAKRMGSAKRIIIIHNFNRKIKHWKRKTNYKKPSDDCERKQLRIRGNATGSRSKHHMRHRIPWLNLMWNSQIPNTSSCILYFNGSIERLSVELMWAFKEIHTKKYSTFFNVCE